MEMENYIIKKLKEFNREYVKIDNPESLEKIYNLWKNGIPEEAVNSMEYLYFGLYHQVISKNYDLMKKYYLLAIKENNIIVFFNIGNYYEYIEKNYDLMKKYYLMGIKEKDSSCMRSLAIYYKNIEKNYDLMKKYFLMAVEENSFFAMNDLAVYYETIEKNYDLARKYYAMALEINHPIIIENIVKYYERNKDLSFVDLYKYEKEFMRLFDKKLRYNINLDKKYHHSFLQWNTKNNIVKMKQYILKKTGIFPKNYSEDYLIHFMEIISLKNTRLPKDMLNLIAGHLFV